MSNWKRGFIEILGEILEELKENSLKKSHIAYKCNLDARSVNKYLKIIMSLNLVEKSKDLKHYIITQKGIKFLDQYRALTNLLEWNLRIELN
ncbi:MAG: hypothetical protein O6761_04930 [Thaumarchaeota archaeon]|nr:hypothetical protein [Nitrososphaerota archaeon]